MNEIKAIETEYKGYRFRSRLEARWAVFFDALGLDWEYEHEGYELPTGERYLPDFLIQSVAMHVEIKAWRTEALSKSEAFVRSGKTLLVIAGNPWPWEYECSYGAPPRICDLVSMPTLQFASFPACNSWGMVISTMDGERGEPIICGRPECAGSVPHWSRPGDSLSGMAVDEAYRSARTARFEHGEGPRLGDVKRPSIDPIVESAMPHPTEIEEEIVKCLGEKMRGRFHVASAISGVVHMLVDGSATLQEVMFAKRKMLTHLNFGPTEFKDIKISVKVSNA